MKLQLKAGDWNHLSGCRNNSVGVVRLITVKKGEDWGSIGVGWPNQTSRIMTLRCGNSDGLRVDVLSSRRIDLFNQPAKQAIRSNWQYVQPASSPHFAS